MPSGGERDDKEQDVRGTWVFVNRLYLSAAILPSGCLERPLEWRPICYRWQCRYRGMGSCCQLIMVSSSMGLGVILPLALSPPLLHPSSDDARRPRSGAEALLSLFPFLHAPGALAVPWRLLDHATRNHGCSSGTGQVVCLSTWWHPVSQLLCPGMSHRVGCLLG